MTHASQRKDARADDHTADPDFSIGVQLGFLWGLAAIYAAGTMWFTRSPILAAIGLALPAVAREVGRRAEPGQLRAAEPMAIWFVGGFGLFLVGIFVQFPMELGWTLMLALNVFLTLGAWAVHRLPSGPVTRPTLSSVRSTTAFGLAMGAGFGVFAMIVISIAGLAGSEDVVVSLRGISLLLGAYLVAGVGGGALIGILRPFVAWPVGRMLLGVLVAALAYSAVGIAMLWMGDPEGPADLRNALVMGGGLGIIAGPMVALAWTAEHG